MPPLSRSILATGLVFLGAALAPNPAAPASVYVHREGIRDVDPVAVSVVDANHSASANLTTGTFGVLATTPAGGVQFSTGAGFQETLTFTNSNPFPFTILARTLRVHLAGSYSVVPPGPSLGTGADSVVFLAVVTTGPTGAAYSARLDHALRRDGIPANDVNQVSPQMFGGASFSVTTASFTSFVCELWMPAITLAPGQTMIVSFQVDAFAQRNSSADFLSPGGATLVFDLPAGISLATNASAPLNWVVVPEPSTTALLAAGCVAVAGFARRRKFTSR